MVEIMPEGDDDITSLPTIWISASGRFHKHSQNVQIGGIGFRDIVDASGIIRTVAIHGYYLGT